MKLNVSIEKYKKTVGDNRRFNDLTYESFEFAESLLKKINSFSILMNFRCVTRIQYFIDGIFTINDVSYIRII